MSRWMIAGSCVRHFVMVGALVLLRAPAGLAQPRYQETVVVSATAEPVPFESLGRSVKILTRREIERLPVRSVTELLQYASSIEVRSRAPRGLQSDFQIRGAGFGQTLVLVNGVRINDSQSGHHNGDIPVALAEVERIEILYGPGSSLYGADAFGGTVNVITRRAGSGIQGSMLGGDFDTAAGHVRLARTKGRAAHSVTMAGDRSSGFMYDRGYRSYGVTGQTSVGQDTHVTASYLWKDFGADGSYGPAPSREWTNQTWLGIERRFTARRGWTTGVSGAYRTHGDHFIYDIRNPSRSENRHRSHAATAVVKGRGSLGPQTRLTVGGETGGDWIRSTNLRDHEYARGSVFAELQQSLGSRVVLYPGVRYDRYSSFGGAWSPSLAASVALSSSVKLRGAAGRAFRIPTFTELYYNDPNHLASPDLRPERAWSVEGGLDYFHAEGWLVTATVFARREREVIDWVRPSTAVRYRTTNVHRVDTGGFELGIRRAVGDDGSVEAHYTWLSSEAEALSGLLSKYVADFARQSFATSASVELPGALVLGQRLDYRRRADGRDYWVADTRLGRQIRAARVFVEVTNLFNTRYEEIRGVRMPSRWVQVGLSFTR